jgi:hypothetical protein
MSTQSTAVERRFLGVVEVESGTLMVGDPCYESRGIDYRAVREGARKPQAVPLAGRPVLVLRNFGGIGTFPVFGDFDGGEPVGIWINLDPPMEGEDEPEGEGC